MTLWKPCLWVYRSVTGSRASSSDRYAIRTRNLQDWNLTRCRCANRSKASNEAVTTLEDAARIARRVLGVTHPTTTEIEDNLRMARAKLPAQSKN